MDPLSCYQFPGFFLLLLFSGLRFSISSSAFTFGYSPLPSRMAEPHPNVTPASSSSYSPAVNGDASIAASSSSTSSQVRQEENVTEHAEFQSPNIESLLMNVNFLGTNLDFAYVAAAVRDDAWSCVVVLLTFWFFENLNDSESGVMLYGTYGTPPLDRVITWEETRNLSVPYDSHKEWIYYLNKGSRLNISYRLSSDSSSIFLVIAQGSEGLTQWLEDPTYPDSTLSWNIIHGTGMITQDIYSSSSYYVVVGNLNDDVQVELNIRVRTFLYNTSNAYHKCALTSNPCGLSIFFPEGNTAVLATAGPEENTSSIKLSYGPRWITYFFGVGGITLLMLLAFYFLNKFLFAREDRPPVVYEETESQSAPLLSYKDDDLSSWGSSFDYLSHDEEDYCLLTGGFTNGKSLGDGETLNNSRRLCAVCFDAPRNCFFLPCGHCVACFECATRIAEAAGICPVCRKNMKKVKKIFTV